MLFNSYAFVLVFLPAALAGAFWLAHRRGPGAAMLWLALASFFFYGWWDARYVPLLAASVAFNYMAGQAIARRPAGAARLILGLAIAADIGLLGYFKYAGFFGAGVNRLTTAQTKLFQHMIEKAYFFAGGFQQRDVNVREGDQQGQTGKARPGSDINEAQAGRHRHSLRNRE